MKKIPTIIEKIPAGILQKIEGLPGITLPWSESSSLLDIDYVYRWSGYKSISPLVAHLLSDDGTMSDAGYTTLAGIVWSHFGTAWTKKYNALTTQYLPLENYNMVEEEDNTITDDADTRVTGSANDNVVSTTASHNVYGYNSSSPTPSDSDSASTSTDTDLDTKYDNERVIDRTLTRHGNIGVTTSQQMLESELQLRAYRFFEEVFKDIDRILALQVYDGEVTDKIYNGSGGGSGTVSVTSVNGKTGDVTLYGSDINLTMLVSQTVADAIQNLNTQKLNKPTVLTQAILSGASSVSFTNDAIGDDSEIDIYLNKSGVNVTGWTQSGHVFTINLSNVTESTVVTVEVFNG